MLIPAASEATPVENGLTVEAITPRPGAEEDDRGRRPCGRTRARARAARAARRSRASPPTSRRRCRRGRRRHQDRDQDGAAVPEPQREAADPGLDRLGLHRHGDERADREDEEEDRGRAVEEALLPRADEALAALDAVEAVRRRVPQLLEAEAEGGVDARLAGLARGDRGAGRRLASAGGDAALCRRVRPAARGGRGRRASTTAARDRCPAPGHRSRVGLVRARRNEERRDPDEQEDGREDGERGRELELLRVWCVGLVCSALKIDPLEMVAPESYPKAGGRGHARSPDRHTFVAGRRKMRRARPRPPRSRRSQRTSTGRS